jgi:hypothetical protein
VWECFWSFFPLPQKIRASSHLPSSLFPSCVCVCVCVCGCVWTRARALHTETTHKSLPLSNCVPCTFAIIL